MARLMRRIKRADREVLCRYACGRLGRWQAMEALGIDWYGDLLLLLGRSRLPMPLVSIERRKVMVAKLIEIFDQVGVAKEKAD